MMRTSLICSLICWGSISTSLADDPKKVEFNRDVRPILSDRCFACHGPNEADREAGLRLDEASSAYGLLESANTAVVPGKPNESELIRRITSTDEFEMMPPPDSGKSLTDEEKEILRRWIEQGAEYQGHWAFITPKRPAVPVVEKNGGSVNAIDAFIRARLAEQGLSPAEQADRRTLIRRVTFDLTGLPPTPDEVEAFVSDSSPDAYERLVDRLLASPAFGEHMARYWLDAVRYGDTHGLHLDNYREMWPYRDWVIGAFNQNMSYDRFVTEQLAGDLLPNPTRDQLIASGFNRCNVTTNEGGSITEEVYVRNVLDRTSAASTIFMGLTGGCAVCHDHKFDPITMTDFYSLFAFFNNIDGSPMDGNKKDHAPVIRVPTPDQERQITVIETQMAELEQRIRQREESADEDFNRWLAQAEAYTGSSSDVLSGLIAHYPLDESSGTEVRSTDSERTGRFQGNVQWVDGQFGKALKFNGGGFVDLGDVGRFDRTDSFSYGCWLQAPGNNNGTPIARMEDGNGYRGWDLYIAGRKVAMHLINRWTADALKVTTKQNVLTPNKWHHVFITYDGSSRADGVTIYVDGKPQPFDVNVNTLKSTTMTETPLRLGKRNPGSPFNGGVVDDVRIYNRTLSADEVATLAGSDPIRPILSIAATERTPQQSATLRRHFLNQHDEEYQRLTAQRAKLLSEQSSIENSLATTLIYRERKEIKPAHILKRGQYDQKGEVVSRNTPGFLPPFPEDAPRNRLGLARWLIGEEHPLFARVAVNRFWQQSFGTGIVKTSEDFGSQGEWPSHLELLDWLAVEFRESGWDVKHLMRLIVTSATYRQSARVTSELQQIDPENQLLARGPRFRLDAEMLRDQALAISGLLVNRPGGPSVKPPQPLGIWKAVGYTSSNTANFRADSGDNVYRRSVYTFWKRTAPPPQMRTFDAPSRESCRVRRERTNTPLQALVVMNERQFVEASRNLGQRAMTEAGESTTERIRYMFSLASARPPADDELAFLSEFYIDCLTIYQANKEAAERLIRVGDAPPDSNLDPAQLAAWTMVGNLVLNLDEVVTKP